jgi:2'-5' RNA ligase
MEALKKNQKPIRGFVAIQVPQSIQQIATDLQTHKLVQQLNLRWSRVEDLHITLKFLANINPDHLPKIIDVLSSQLINTGLFYLQLGPLQFFPSTKHPKILSLKMQYSKKCFSIVQILNNALLELDYPIEAREFRGHVTLARLKTRGKHDDLCSQDILNQIVVPTIPKILISELYFFESKPSSSGSDYLPLVRFNLL